MMQVWLRNDSTLLHLLYTNKCTTGSARKKALQKIRTINYGDSSSIVLVPKYKYILKFAVLWYKVAKSGSNL